MQNHAEKEALAIELAEALNDLGSLPFYRRCVEWHTEDFLREKLSKVLSMRNVQNKGAYFNKLVSNNDRKPRRPWA